MEPAILVIEFNSVAGGIFVTDLLVKEAAVAILDSRTVCPGKYVVTVSGDVEALRSAFEAARESDLGETITEHHLLPRVHPLVVAAAGGETGAAGQGAVGVIETYGVPACVRAADAGAKAAGVAIADLRLANAQGGKSVVIFAGTQRDVEEALAAGKAAAEEMRGLINAVIVERPHDCVARFLEA